MPFYKLIVREGRGVEKAVLQVLRGTETGIKDDEDKY